MGSEYRNTVFKNRKALSQRYIPKYLPYREKELKMLVNMLYSFIDSGFVRNTLILGRTGVGKTATVMKAIEDVKADINPDESMIIYAIADDSIKETLRNISLKLNMTLPKKGLSVFDAKNRVFNAIGNKNALIILDEIDKLFNSRYCETIMYDLTRRENLSLIGITNVMTIMDDIMVSSVLSDRVYSSWNPSKIVFKPYSVNQISDIIKQRSQEVFYDGVISDECIDYLATKAYGIAGADVRYSLDVLGISGDLADTLGLTEISNDLIDKAIDELEVKYQVDSIESLSYTEQCLLYVIAKLSPIQIHKAYEYANKLLYKYFKTSLSSRRWADRRFSLELAGYIKVVKHSGGRGRGLKHNLVLNESINPDFIVKTIEKLWKL